MFTTFWGTMFGGQYKKWNINAFLPPLLFWGGGMAVWYESNGWGLNIIWNKFDYLSNLDSTQVGIFLFLLISLMIVSYKFAEWLQFPLIRFIEGYWPFYLNCLKSYLVERLESNLKSKKIEWDILAKNYNNLEISQKKKFIKLDNELEQYPLLLKLPTRFGNLLRVAEEYPFNRYGLETIRVWPNLWLLIPDRTRKELIESNKVLYDKVTLFFWCSIFFVWTMIAFIEWDSLIWWPLIVSILGVLFVYYTGLIPAASDFGDLLRASFDVHRFTLYEALRLPLPSKPIDEYKDGKNLSKYLKRGLHPDLKIAFIHSETKK